MIWIGDRLVKIGNTDLSKGTIYDVPSIIANTKRPAIMVLDAEHHIDLHSMDNVSVAIGMINQIQEEAKQDFNITLFRKQIQEETVKNVIPLSPSKKLCESVQSFAVKR